MALIFWTSKLSWASTKLPSSFIGTQLGVSTRTVNYWLSGERIASGAHQTALSRLYERTQYTVMKRSGLAPLSAAKYRGLSPSVFDAWESRLNDITSRMTADRTTAYLQRQGIDPMDLTDAELDELEDKYREGVLDGLDNFGGDIEDAERYF